MLANDTDPDGDTLTPVIAAQPTQGAVEVNNDGTLTYTPAGGFAGVDSFTYRASDGDRTSNLATVTVAVANAAPTAVDDEASTGRNQPVDIAVLDNDSDPDGDTLSVTGATTPANGTVTIDNGTVTYEPAPGFSAPTPSTTPSPTASPTTPPPSPSRSPTPPPPRSTTKHRPAGTSRSTSPCWTTTPTPTATP